MDMCVLTQPVISVELWADVARGGIGGLSISGKTSAVLHVTNH